MQWIMLHLSPSGHGMPLNRPVVENMVLQWTPHKGGWTFVQKNLVA
jgi:hypothetical protein